MDPNADFWLVSITSDPSCSTVMVSGLVGVASIVYCTSALIGTVRQVFLHSDLTDGDQSTDESALYETVATICEGLVDTCFVRGAAIPSDVQAEGL